MPDCPVTVVLPCLNEEASLPGVLAGIPAGYRALVVDNNSTDGTAEVARHHGADVVAETRPGYGSAVHAGVVAATTPIVAVLDVMMPGPDGLTLCRSLRQHGGYPIPVILLTALGEEDDRIAGLEAGADDYVTKPFSPRELALRVRSVLRRVPAPATALPLEISAGDLTVSTAARAVHVAGQPVNLTNREFDLLLFFLTHADAVFSREELLKRVWRWEFGDLSTVTVHVKRLRAKLGDHHSIQTVWGRGYLWQDAR